MNCIRKIYPIRLSKSEIVRLVLLLCFFSLQLIPASSASRADKVSLKANDIDGKTVQLSEKDTTLLLFFNPVRSRDWSCSSETATSYHHSCLGLV